MNLPVHRWLWKDISPGITPPGVNCWLGAKGRILEKICCLPVLSHWIGQRREQNRHQAYWSWLMLGWKFGSQEAKCFVVYLVDCELCLLPSSDTLWYLYLFCRDNYIGMRSGALDAVDFCQLLILQVAVESNIVNIVYILLQYKPIEYCRSGCLP